MSAILLALAAGCFISEGEHQRHLDDDADADGLAAVDDCDDNDPATLSPPIWYLDADDDGSGGEQTIAACAAPDGYVADGGDCDDDDPAVGAPPLWYDDRDDDGHGDPAASEARCDADGGVSTDDDCDDGDAATFPGAEEICDGDGTPVDNDCDGDVDEGIEVSVWYADDDGDGYGDLEDRVDACAAPDGYVAGYDPDSGFDASALDCDDDDDSVHPAADEYCDGTTDEDCDGDIDESGAIDADAWYADADADDYGDPAISTAACEQPSGYVADGEDCDDADASAYPSAPELCDEADNDCDGATDEAPPTWYDDADGDGYGDPSAPIARCDQGDAADNDSDCDDDDAGSYPGADEYCTPAGVSATDEDCDGAIDESGAIDAATWYADDDGDGYGDAADDTIACADSAGEGPSGYAASATDCDDADDASYPGAPAVCGDGVVNDCDASDDADERAECALSGDYAASEASLTLLGEAGGDYAGAALAGAGDVDGDGLQDLLVGAWGQDDGGDGAGMAYLVFGGATGSLDLGGADTRLMGEAAGDHAGYAVAGLGDVDGDGLSDVAVGAVDESTGGVGAGAAYLLRGGTAAPGGAGGGLIDLAGADLKLTGEDAGDYAGVSVGGAGDVDGDGLDDLLIGAYGEDAGGDEAGAAYLFLGPVTAVVSMANRDTILTGEDAGDEAGRSIDGAGDVNGDGYDDVVIGALNNDDAATDAGAAYLIEGDAKWTGALGLQWADAQIEGANSYSYAGVRVAGAGDWDNDGFDDLLIGAYGVDGGGSNAGATYLVLGSVSGVRGDFDLGAESDVSVIYGAAAGDRSGEAVGAAGDLDGDGLDELLIGAPYADSEAGSAYLFGALAGNTFYLSDSADYSASFAGAASGDRSGATVAGPGDTDGDGLRDLAVGAPYDDSADTDAGAVRVFAGPGI